MKMPWIKKAEPITKQHKPASIRAYAGAEVGRLTEDWAGDGARIKDLLLSGAEILRKRARDLEQNDDYIRRFLQMAVSNVVGWQGIRLQAQSRDDNGQLDKAANDEIEGKWRIWGKPGVCEIGGRLSWIDLQGFILRRLLVDGEVFLHKLVDDNGFGFALDVIPSEFCDINANRAKSSGVNEVQLGVELDSRYRPVAYYFLDSEQLYATNHRRIPANEIIHLYIPERPRQVRGVTWLASSMLRKRMLDAYQHATVVGARVAASKMGFFKPNTEAGYQGEGVDPDGWTVASAEPGTFEELPAGVDFAPFDPSYPPTGFKEFSQEILRGIASGLGVSYVTMSNNLEGVNYSSIRQGELADRDFWRTWQRWITEHMCEPVFTRWLTMALTTQALALPFAKREKFANVTWRPRGWEWVDPLKMANANKVAISMGLTSRSRIVADQGLDIEDLFSDLDRENKLGESHSISIGANNDEKTLGITNIDEADN